MLGLASATDPRWVERAVAHMDTVLVDHAHCERKAAATALALLSRYPDREALLEPLSRLAREEMEHFERVLAVLRRRGVRFGGLPASPYASRLHAAVRKGEPGRLLDLLLCAAIIEARSCERMKLLAGRLEDPELRDLYESLLESEARHHASYVDLARRLRLAPEPALRERLRELGEHEARVLAEAPPVPRFHN